MTPMVKYFDTMDIISQIEHDLVNLHPDDMRFVLEIILPEGSNIDLAIKDLMEWKAKLNLDTMKN